MTRVVFCHPRPCAPNLGTRLVSAPCFLCPGSVAPAAPAGQ